MRACLVLIPRHTQAKGVQRLIRRPSLLHSAKNVEIARHATRLSGLASGNGLVLKLGRRRLTLTRLGADIEAPGETWRFDGPFGLQEPYI
jgi:hypothetical protein